MAAPDDTLDIVLRLAAAVGAGAILGLNRDLNGKPTGARTLGLVALSAALVSLATVSVEGMADSPDALSRVIQGLIQGVLAGIGFLGAGVIIRDHSDGTVQNLTTAATVWATAALGLACGLAAWPIIGIGLLFMMLVLMLGGPLERLNLRLSGGTQAQPAREARERP
jgi:putative Mg2+ transporter-C (MgtC) family protein